MLAAWSPGSFLGLQTGVMQFCGTEVGTSSYGDEIIKGRGAQVAPLITDYTGLMTLSLTAGPADLGALD
ncbi:MAG: hypothetical protein ABJE10_21850, partial [bacterium]